MRPSRTGDRPLSLNANFAWALVGNALYALCQWGMLAVLARLGTPEVVGQFSLGLAVGAPVMMLANLQLRQVLATDAGHEYPFEIYYSTRLLTTALAFGAILALGAFTASSVETMAVIWTLGLQKSIRSVSEILHGLLQQRERLDRVAKTLLAKGPIALVGLGLTYALTGSVILATASVAGVYLFTLFAMDYPNARMARSGAPIRPLWDASAIKKLVVRSLPLGIVTMVVSLNANAPNYIIEHHLGTEALGIFAAMVSLKLAGNTAIEALGQSISPRLSHHYAAGDIVSFSVLLGRVALVVLALGLAGVLAVSLYGDKLMAMLYGTEYARYPAVLTTVMISAAITYLGSIIAYALTAARMIKPQAPIAIVGLLSTALAGLALIPGEGLAGAAQATLIGASVSTLLRLACLVWLAGRRHHAYG